MITYNYTITSVRCADQGDMKDVVRQVDFNLTGVDGECSFSLPGSVKFEDELDPSNFVPFDSLTEAQVAAWAASSPATAGLKAHIALVVERMAAEAALAKKPMPWAPPEPAVEPPPALPQ